MKAPGRVLLTTDCVGGVWTYTVELCRELNRLGLECVVASMGRAPDLRERRELTDLQGTRLFMSDFALEWMNQAWNDVDRAGEWLLQLAQDEKVDLIHLNGFAHALLPWRRPVLVVGHSCVCSWYGAVAPDHTSHVDPEYKRRVAAGLAAADLVVAPSQSMLAELRRLYNWRGFGQVISNGIRKPDIGHPLKENIIVTAGRAWDRAKGVDRLVARDEIFDWPIHVLGDRPDRQIDSRFQWHGRKSRDEVFSWLQRARIYAAPARYEPFGLAVLEAAYCGCCLLLSDLPTFRENWDGAAEFVPNRATADWPRAINKLIRSSDRWDELGEAARQRAQSFSSRRMGERYLIAYHWLTSRTIVSTPVEMI